MDKKKQKKAAGKARQRKDKRKPGKKTDDKAPDFFEETEEDRELLELTEETIVVASDGDEQETVDLTDIVDDDSDLGDILSIADDAAVGGGTADGDSAGEDDSEQLDLSIDDDGVKREEIDVSKEEALSITEEAEDDAELLKLTETVMVDSEGGGETVDIDDILDEEEDDDVILDLTDEVDNASGETLGLGGVEDEDDILDLTEEAGDEDEDVIELTDEADGEDDLLDLTDEVQEDEVIELTEEVAEDDDIIDLVEESSEDEEIVELTEEAAEAEDDILDLTEEASDDDILDLTQETVGDEDVLDLTEEAQDEDVLDLTQEASEEEEELPDLSQEATGEFDVLDLTEEAGVQGAEDAETAAEPDGSSEVSIELTEDEVSGGVLDLANTAEPSTEEQGPAVEPEPVDVLEEEPVLLEPEAAGEENEAPVQAQDENGAFAESLDTELGSALDVPVDEGITPEEEERRLQQAEKVAVHIHNRPEVEKPTSMDFDAMREWHNKVRAQVIENCTEMISDEHLEAAVAKAIKDVYSEKIEKMIAQVLEKTITNEIERLKKLLTGDN